MENSLRNHAMVYQQNQQRRQRKHHQHQQNHPPRNGNNGFSSAASVGEPQHLQQYHQQYGRMITSSSAGYDHYNINTGVSGNGGSLPVGIGSIPQNTNGAMTTERNMLIDSNQNYNRIHNGSGSVSSSFGSRSRNSGGGGGLSASYSEHKQHSRQLYAQHALEEQQQQQQQQQYQHQELYYANGGRNESQFQQQSYERQGELQRQPDGRSRGNRNVSLQINNYHQHQQQPQQRQQQFHRNSQQPYQTQYQQQYHNASSHHDSMSMGSQYSVGSHESSTVEDRYKEWGQRLSRRAHGDSYTPQNGRKNSRQQIPTRVERIGLTKSSAFTSYEIEPTNIIHDIPGDQEGVDDPEISEGSGPESSASGNSVNRINKVAKKRFSDHGNHHAGSRTESSNSNRPDEETPLHRKRPPDNLLMMMTKNADDIFRRLYNDHNDEGSRSSNNNDSNGLKQRLESLPNDLSPLTDTHLQSSTNDQQEHLSPSNLTPQQKALEKLALDGGRAFEQKQSPRAIHHQHHFNPPESSTDLFTSNLERLKKKQPNGLLSAVMEQSSVTSSNPHSGGRDSSSIVSKDDGKGGGEEGSFRSRDSRGSSSIATRSSMGTKQSVRSFGAIPPQGKCLTNPSEGVSNDGHDNSDGNLIAYENDTISVGRKQIHVLTREKMKGAQHADFRIQSLLGQGTFAQVFQCLHVQTGNIVAVKVVKNMPAYTRQAAVEIDVLRALEKQPSSLDQSISSTGNHGKSHTPTDRSSPGADNGRPVGSGGADEWDYTVDMVCYFIYKGHLCLVFELLGMNLYEVLKKRQFRGLPLSVVRTLVRQAVMGLRELAQKSIVHCDLKPENVLLATDDDSDSVVTAGESKRLSSSLKSSSSKEMKFLSSGQHGITSNVPKTCGRQDDKPESSTNSNTTSDTANTSSNKTQPSSSDLRIKIQSNAGTEAAETSEKSAVEAMQNAESIRATNHSPAHSDGTGASGGGTQLLAEKRIKLIDFGSACFEGQSNHTYIQSRFYRSPEVLVGLAFDSAIDMWSLGCVTAELFLGLPILPGVHEHDQVGRIQEMIGEVPDWMLDKGVKSSKYFVKFVPPPTPPAPPSPARDMVPHSPAPRLLPQWRLKSQQEYIESLSQNEIRRKGGLSKLEKQPKTRYFRRRRLVDIVLHKGQSGSAEDKELLRHFVHFLYGILDPDPWKRLTAFQAASHPFLTGAPLDRRMQTMDEAKLKEESLANQICDAYWNPPSDPNVYRRQLLHAQKMREKQQAARRGRHDHPRTPSPGGQNGLAGVLEQSPHSSRTLKGNHNRRNGRNTIQSTDYQLSSSMTDHVNQENVLLSDDSSMMSAGSNIFFSGPQSYNDNGPVMPGSFNELDFAYALQRPGVVPMGESYSSSVDMSIGSSGSAHAPPYLIQQHPNISSQTNQSSIQHQLGSRVMSRSFGEGQGTNGIPLDIDRNGHLHPRQQQQYPTEVTGRFNDLSQLDQRPSIINAPLGSANRNQEVTVQSQSHAMNPPKPFPTHSMASQPVPAMESVNRNVAIAPGQIMNHVGPFGTQDAQAFFQKQQAALEQQRMILMQQQATLAMQQEQLRAYEMSRSTVAKNPLPTTAMSTNTIPNGLSSPHGPHATASTSVPGNQLCYATAADGTPVLVQMNTIQGTMHPNAQVTNMLDGQPQSFPVSINNMLPIPQQFQVPNIIPNMNGIPTATGPLDGSRFVGMPYHTTPQNSEGTSMTNYQSTGLPDDQGGR